MAPKLPRTSTDNPFNSARLIRYLAELSTTDVAVSKQSLAQRLGLWLGWADAISISAVLNGNPAQGVEPQAGGLSDAAEAAAEFARVRAGLAHSITTDRLLAAPTSPMKLPRSASDIPAATPSDGAADFGPYRRCHAGHQRAMETGVGLLRSRVRGALLGGSPALARLAALDAVLDDALGARERTLLASLPAWLEKRFQQLRPAQPLATEGAGQQPASQPAAWLALYRSDMRDVLLAELELRLQPVEGLLEALAGAPSLTPIRTTLSA